MSKNYISGERLKAQLRSNSISHLGEVKRLYLEANGSFTLIRNENPQDGLSVIPGWDHEMRDEQELSDLQACCNCGKTDSNPKKCSNCGNESWEPAIKGSVKNKTNVAE